MYKAIKYIIVNMTSGIKLPFHPIPSICECSDINCNEITWNGRKYIRFHHMKGNQLRKGIPISLIASKKMSEIRKGKHPSQETLKKMSKNNCMKRLEIVAQMSGENHPNWLGGKSFGIYCPKFNNKKKEEIRNKYNRCCIICNKSELKNITKMENKLNFLSIILTIINFKVVKIMNGD